MLVAARCCCSTVQHPRQLPVFLVFCSSFFSKQHHHHRLVYTSIMHKTLHATAESNQGHATVSQRQIVRVGCSRGVFKATTTRHGKKHDARLLDLPSINYLIYLSVSSTIMYLLYVRSPGTKSGLHQQQTVATVVWLSVQISSWVSSCSQSFYFFYPTRPPFLRAACLD